MKFPQAPNNSESSVWTLLLSSSLGLAIITGLLYLLGGTWEQGRTEALGLGYLSGPQPNDYVFMGAELVLTSIWCSVLLGASIGGAFAVDFGLRNKPLFFPRKWEFPIFIFLALVVASFVLGLTFHTLATMSRSDIINSACPILPRPQGAGYAEEITLSLIAIGLVIPSFFCHQQLRWAFRTTVVSAGILALFNFGLAAGENQLGNPFGLVKISDPNIIGSGETTMLVLGSDERGLVILEPRGSQREHPEPIYLSRSDIKKFRVVGTSTINNFFCSSSQKTNPGKH